MKTQVELKLNPGERTALRCLTAEERQVVVDEMLEQVREDLAWMMALEVARDAPPANVTPLRRKLRAK